MGIIFTISKCNYKTLKLLVLLILLQVLECRKHFLSLKDDSRGEFRISTFGFYKNGILQVKVDKFRINLPTGVSPDQELVGFSLEKTANPYTDQHSEKCTLENFKKNDSMVQQVFFLFNLTSNYVQLRCSVDMENLLIFKDMGQISSRNLGTKKTADSTIFSRGGQMRTPRDTEQTTQKDALSTLGGEAVRDKSPGVECKKASLKMEKTSDGNYDFKFAIYVFKEREEGLYNLNFHNCFNYKAASPKSTISMELNVEEKNPDDNYLSAGEMPLPALYLMMSLLFFLSACFWFFLLRKSKDPVFKIHYLMGILVVIKSLSLLFHGINFHFIQIRGDHIEAWAVMFYIMHLLKGALLFTVLALIGSGWAFVKHVLSSKEKKMFIIVIPLQIIANVAMIIIEESEEWDSDRALWVQLLFLIDFLCCGAILLPVVWSIRHLQEASQTDGKAAINLEKLKLFRHFYIMIVCYIYFTRIIVYLLRITVPFEYEWLDDMFREMATYVFFVMTGYKFRPATNNPYFKVDSDEELEEVLTTTGLTENLIRVNQRNGSAKYEKSRNSQMSEEIYDDDEEVNLLDVRDIIS